MSYSALLLMASTMGIVTIFTLYFYIKVFKAPKRRYEHEHMPDPADFGKREM